MSENWDLISVLRTDPVFGASVGVQPLQTHGRAQCQGRACCIHNPSAHPLNGAPLNWRADLRVMERICPHRAGHPDPDHLAYVREHFGPVEAEAQGIHGSDGCCRG